MALIHKSTALQVSKSGAALSSASLGLALLLAPAAVSEANAQVVTVPRTCKNHICAKSEYWGGRVRLTWSGSPLTRHTHYNFKTNPGAQIERPGNYSFEQRPGRKGTYSIQSCDRGGIGSRSTCSRWVTFDWRS